MSFTADDFRRRYADMSDMELLSLSRDELGEVARTCYDLELGRRGMTAAPVQTAAAPEDLEEASALPEAEAGMDSEAEQREEEDLAPEAIFRTRDSAKAARERCRRPSSPRFWRTRTWPRHGCRGAHPAASGSWRRAPI